LMVTAATPASRAKSAIDTPAFGGGRRTRLRRVSW
jgi:hypothetical protein